MYFFMSNKREGGKMAKKLKILKGRFHPRNKKMWSLFWNCSWGFYPYVFFYPFGICVVFLFYSCYKKMLQHQFRGVQTNLERLCPFDLKTEIWIVLFFLSRQKSDHNSNCSKFVCSFVSKIANRHHYIATIDH